MGRIENVEALESGAALPGVEDWSKLISSPEQAVFGGNFLIYGPPGHGKTTVAATLSEFFPHERLEMTREQLAGEKIIELEDMFWVDYDPAATAALAQFRVKVRSLNMKQVFAQLGPTAPLVWARRCDEILDTVLPSKLTGIVDDTLSSYDHKMTEYWASNAPKSKAGNKDGVAMWVEVRMTHIRRKNHMDSIAGHRGAQLMTLAHAAVRMEKDPKEMGAAQANARREAEGQEGDIVPMITGKAEGVFKADAEVWVLMRESVGRGPEKRFLYRKLDGWETKSRLSGFLDEKEPANLRQMLNKVRKGMGLI